jgi:DNA-directed RNA polymerase subunit RPC12/RpoP
VTSVGRRKSFRKERFSIYVVNTLNDFCQLIRLHGKRRLEKEMKSGICRDCGQQRDDLEEVRGELVCVRCYRKRVAKAKEALIMVIVSGACLSFVAWLWFFRR